MNHPTTMSEWKGYLQTLSGEDLRSKAIAANSTAFRDCLRRDGFEAESISAIILMFAARLLEDAQEPPGGGYVDYLDIISNDEDLRERYQALMAAPF